MNRLNGKGAGLWIFTAIIVLITGASAEAIDVNQTFEFKGHYYYMPSPKDATYWGWTWEEARAYAAAQTVVLKDRRVLKGHLLTINSQAEQDFVSSKFIQEDWLHLWLGAYQYSRESEPDGAWAWVTGEEAGNIRTEWSYSFLIPGQPGNDRNPFSENENVLGMLINNGHGTPWWLPGVRNSWGDFASATPAEPGASWIRFVVEFDEIGDHFVRPDAPPDNAELSACRNGEKGHTRVSARIK